MENLIQVLVLKDSQILITQIEEVSSDLGQPDCKLSKPFLVKYSGANNELILSPWLSEYTLNETFMIHSDKILTLTDPKPTLLEKYKSLIK